jgi:hypothetical protein
MGESLKTIVLWNNLYDFIKREFSHRDKSHDILHCQKVAIGSVELCIKEMPNATHHEIDILISASWLHDTLDEKYKDFTKEDLVRFIKTQDKLCDHVEVILNIIDNISFSKENQAILSGTPINYDKLLGKYTIIRHIISDIDKLEAINEDGLDRCINYTSHFYKKKNNTEISSKQLKNEVEKHAKEKLLRLKDQFIRTNNGKEMAFIAHEKFATKLNEFIDTF